MQAAPTGELGVYHWELEASVGKNATTLIRNMGIKASKGRGRGISDLGSTSAFGGSSSALIVFLFLSSSALIPLRPNTVNTGILPQLLATAPRSSLLTLSLSRSLPGTNEYQ